MRKIVLAIVAAAAILTVGSLQSDRAAAMTLGTATADARPAADNLVTNVAWWGRPWHHRRFVVVRSRVFVIPHRRYYAYYRPHFYHRYWCRWC